MTVPFNPYLKIAQLSEKYDLLEEFIRKITETKCFSTANHWYLHLEAKKILEKIGETSE